MEANKEKELGNAAMSSGDFQKAIEHYTNGIALEESNHVLYSNRSAAYASLKQYDKALEDANLTIKHKPDWARGYSRKGAALCYLGRLEEAQAAYDEALKIEPNNEQLKQALSEVEQQIASTKPSLSFEDLFGNMFQGDVLGKLAENETTKAYLEDPSFLAIIKNVQQNPSSITQYLEHPYMSKVIPVLMGIAPKKGAEEPKPTPMEEDKKPEPVPEPEPPVEIPANKVQALEEKEKGNAAYKKKDFETAIAHYTKAKELDPDDMTYSLNTSAALFEDKKYDECIKTCEEAIDTGRRVYADYKLIAKAFHRIGNAYSRLEKYEEAIKSFNSALTEHRTPETIQALQRAEKAKLEKEKLSYLSPEKSLEAKNAGNEAFRNGDYPTAIKMYTEAIQRNPTDHVLYSNRAATYMKLGEYPLGLKDCDKCIELDPNFVKGYTRKGHIQFFMKQYHKCLETYDKGLKLEPENAELIEGIQRTIAAINARQSSSDAESEKEAAAAAANDSELQDILQDPVMRRVIGDMQNDPASSQAYMRDPVISAKLQKLIAAGILKVK